MISGSIPAPIRQEFPPELPNTMDYQLPPIDIPGVYNPILETITPPTSPVHYHFAHPPTSPDPLDYESDLETGDVEESFPTTPVSPSEFFAPYTEVLA